MEQDQGVEIRLRELREYSAAVKGKGVLDGYDPIMDEMGRWDLQTKSQLLLTCLEQVLRAMDVSAIYILRNELQVQVVPKGVIRTVFPIRKHPFRQRPKMKVLLVIGEDRAENSPEQRTCNELAKEFRRVLRYLRRREN